MTHCKKYLVVGGAGGLGFEIAARLTGKGNRVVIADRNKPREILSGSEFIHLDLMSDDYSALDGLDIDGLVITAGIGRLDWFENATEEDIERNFRINVVAPIRIVKKYWKRIDAVKVFEAVIVSSIAGMLASPLYSLYSASKAGLVKFMEAVNAELAHKGRANRILNVAPGRIDGTGFHGRDADRTSAQQDAITKLAEEIIVRMEKQEEVYIPKWDEVYSGVLKRYHTDPIGFALSSLDYKLGKKS